MSANLLALGLKAKNTERFRYLHLNQKSLNQSKIKHRINQQMRVNFM